MLNVAVIGCGPIGKLHANAFAKCEKTNLCALIDTNLTAAEALASDFGGKAYASIDEVPEKIDVVAVATPAMAHFSVVMDLLDRGIDVLCEKPLTINVEEARAVEAKCSETGKSVGIGFKMRYEEVFLKAKELIGQLGRIYAASEVKSQPCPPEGWKVWMQKSGCMHELAVHDYDLVEWLMETDAKSVYAALDYSYGWETENGACLTVEYENGARGMLLSEYSIGAGTVGGYDCAMTFIGENGYMRIERPNRIVLHTKSHQVIDVKPITDAQAFERQANAFVDSIINKTPFAASVESGVSKTVFVEAAHRSAKEEKKVYLKEI